MFINKNNLNDCSLVNFKNAVFPDIKNKVDCAIISAMPEESEYFLEQFSGLTFNLVKIGEFDFRIYNYQKSKVLIVPTGIGSVFAASVLTLIHSYFHPDYFLVCGTAGAINEKLKIGDVVIVEKAFEAEIQDTFTLLENTPFEGALTHPVKNECFPSHYAADDELLNHCDLLKFKNIILHRGTVVSSNAFPAPKELFEKIKRFKPYSIDMETSSFYQTAWLLNTKILAIRGISNILNSDGTDENVHQADLKKSAFHACHVLHAILNASIFSKNHSQENSMTVLTDEAQQLIKAYNLQAHPEGGYFAAVYKSRATVNSTDPRRYNNESRSAGTSIYYLLDKKDYSAWHSLKSDEIWHFYRGSPLYIYVIDKAGVLHTYILGDPLQTKDAAFQVCIEAGDYFAAEVVDKNLYSFVGCTVSPGFEYRDFQLADPSTLKNLFPEHQEMIERLSHFSFDKM